MSTDFGGDQAGILLALQHVSLDDGLPPRATLLKTEIVPLPSAPFIGPSSALVSNSSLDSLPALSGPSDSSDDQGSSSSEFLPAFDSSDDSSSQGLSTGTCDALVRVRSASDGSQDIDGALPIGDTNRTQLLRQDTLKKTTWMESSPIPIPVEVRTLRQPRARALSRTDAPRFADSRTPTPRPLSRNSPSYFPQFHAPPPLQLVEDGGGYESGGEGLGRRSPATRHRPVRRTRWLGSRHASFSSLRSGSSLVSTPSAVERNFSGPSPRLPPQRDVVDCDIGVQLDNDKGRLDQHVLQPSRLYTPSSPVSLVGNEAAGQRTKKHDRGSPQVDEMDITDVLERDASDGPQLMKPAPLTPIVFPSPSPAEAKPAVASTTTSRLDQEPPPGRPLTIGAFFRAARSAQADAKTQLHRNDSLVGLGIGLPSSEPSTSRPPADAITSSPSTAVASPSSSSADAVAETMTVSQRRAGTSFYTPLAHLKRAALAGQHHHHRTQSLRVGKSALRTPLLSPIPDLELGEPSPLIASMSEPLFWPLLARTSSEAEASPVHTGTDDRV